MDVVGVVGYGGEFVGARLGFDFGTGFRVTIVKAYSWSCTKIDELQGWGYRGTRYLGLDFWFPFGERFKNQVDGELDMAASRYDGMRSSRE